MRYPPVLHWTRFALASSLPWVFVLCRCRILRYSCGNFLNLFSGLVPICFLPARRNRIPSSFLYFHSALVGFRNFSRSLYSITLTSSNKFVSSSSFEFSAFRDVVTSVLFPFPSRLPEISVLSSFLFGNLLPCPSLSPSARGTLDFSLFPLLSCSQDSSQVILASNRLSLVPPPLSACNSSSSWCLNSTVSSPFSQSS